MALVQGQPGCQDALQELLRGSRNVLIGARVCRALPYVHARKFRTRTLPDNDRNASLHDAYLEGKSCSHTNRSSLTMIAMLQLSDASGLVYDGEEGTSQILRGIPRGDNPLQIP
eukprot:13934309-Heterocapsa_arctica.AAC.1